MEEKEYIIITIPKPKDPATETLHDVLLSLPPDQFLESYQHAVSTYSPNIIVFRNALFDRAGLRKAKEN